MSLNGKSIEFGFGGWGKNEMMTYITKTRPLAVEF